MRVSHWLLLALCLAAAPAQAGFVEAIRGNVDSVEDLLRFDAIDDVTGIVLLGVFDDGEQSPGISFPNGSPFDLLTGRVEFKGGTPVYYTVKASNVTGLYTWMDSGNDFDTEQFTSGRGFSNLRVFGNTGIGTALPEPGAALVFAVGLAVVGGHLRRR